MEFDSISETVPFLSTNSTIYESILSEQTKFMFQGLCLFK